MRDCRGQTGAEYLGILLLVAVVVATLGHAGIASAVAGGVEHEVCRIAGDGCAAPAGDGPEIPGAPGAGPAFGSVAYSGAGIPWDGSIELTGTASASAKQGPFTGGAWVKATVSEDRSACRLDETGRQIVRLGVKGTLKTGVTRGISTRLMGDSQDSNTGRSIGWQVATDENTANLVVSGKGRLPTPVDPTTIPARTPISGSRDVTLTYTSADLERLHDMALQQVVHDARRNGVDLTPDQAEHYLQDAPVAGSDVAQGLARQKTPADVVNYLNQQVARGNAAAFVDALARFRQQSLDEGHTGDAAVFPGSSFKPPVC